jgi:FkbM family methyltransferase
MNPTSETIRKMSALCSERRYQRVVLDVGASGGDSTRPIAEGDPDALVIAFEPSPDLAELTRRETSHLQNYCVIEAAVADVPGDNSFNVADLGCGSLLEFAEQQWFPNVRTKQISVPVVRLDAVLGELGIDAVDYLHCDAQGSDLRVLRSLGTLLDRLKAGVIEVPARTRLYDGAHSRRETVRFLVDHGFVVMRIEANDPCNHEQNVYFRRARRSNRLLRSYSTAAFWARSMVAGVRTLPHRLRLVIGMRTRARRLLRRLRR